MFTGIIQEIGTLISTRRSDGLIRLAISAPKTTPKLAPMDSVAVNGACLTVVDKQAGVFAVEMIPETQRRTSLARLKPGMRLNLEPSLTLSDRIGGHLVFGHVDGVGKVRSRRHAAGELVLEIAVDKPLRKFLVAKGPITVDGVSLTVGPNLGGSSFRVHLIPETLCRTTLASRKVGDAVNIEIDYFAKLTREFLRQNHGV